MQADPPVLVVCAVIQRAGLIFLARRPPGKRLADLWEFPGGKIEPGELPAEALHRELAEELGCQVVITQAGPPVLHAYPWGTILLHPFLCHLAPGSPEPQPHEHSTLTWVRLEALTDYDLAPADVPIVMWMRSLP